MPVRAGTNIGIRGIVATGEHGQSEAALRHVRRHYINRDNLRRAIAAVADATFAARDRAWWGEGTACASDSTRFGSWESNLMTECHQRYGGPGVMIYWHVERDSVCICSQLKTCSSSEVAAMIEGLLRHRTTAEIEANYTDTHGVLNAAPPPRGTSGRSSQNRSVLRSLVSGRSVPKESGACRRRRIAIAGRPMQSPAAPQWVA